MCWNYTSSENVRTYFSALRPRREHIHPESLSQNRLPAAPYLNTLLLHKVETFKLKGHKSRRLFDFSVRQFLFHRDSRLVASCPSFSRHPSTIPSFNQTNTRRLHYSMSSLESPSAPIDTDLDPQNLLSSRLDELVRSGALTVDQGHELTLDKDGLPTVSDVDPKTNVKQNQELQRLDNLIQFLESPIAPQSVDWNSTRKDLCRLRDRGVPSPGDADFKAWLMVMIAHRSTMGRLGLLESLLGLLEAKKLDADRLKRIHEVAQDFLKHACYLVGISTPDDIDNNSWDDGLAEIVLDKSIEVYRCIDGAWSALRDGQRRDFQGPSTKPERRLRRFLDLDVIKALNGWRDYDVFVILDRKAITAHRLRQAST
ncbi:hypothetical protein LCI18_008760 [Fusarium solani-melongenae]|uniref:Uncharacterized protein n=1 Tax=Fusarium solani subsp. cucurbitae TaxID=2747967 RepID=A0ACD3Z9N6_FUSSC|nr:hypothetical protein LCI18_008760 [Fusarium solani-melongenae]